MAAQDTVLPDGRVLIWGRRDAPDQSLDEHACTPFLWDPQDSQTIPTPQPRDLAGNTVNLICSGHAYLPDGRLLVVGGHFRDGQGLDQASVCDPVGNTWTAAAAMNDGRWYPTALSLPDGRILVLSGSYGVGDLQLNNTVPQVWLGGAWTDLDPFPGDFELYPRLHAATSGDVLMSGPLTQTWMLDLDQPGGPWRTIGARAAGRRDYCPSVQYGPDQVLYIGGGNDAGTGRPTALCETLDLSAPQPQWQPTDPLHTARRQHNATLLADGTVLVTGGTRGVNFNDLGAGEPVHVAELWDPTSGRWTEVAAERIDRCYHSTALLLPDGRVLSAGGGEFRPQDGVDVANAPQDSHRDAQIFSPPYLFRGTRPQITAAPTAVAYGSAFAVTTDRPQDISHATWLRLSSVTHSANMNQRFQRLEVTVRGADEVTVTAPATPDDCPPGHYLMFLLTPDGVPSEAVTVLLQAPAVTPVRTSSRPGERSLPLLSLSTTEPEAIDPATLTRPPHTAESGTLMVLGITGLCPYGIGACWGGASEALHQLDGVLQVAQAPDPATSTAALTLTTPGVPPLSRWRDQFTAMVNGSYQLRGFEVTLTGHLDQDQHALLLDRGVNPSSVRLGALQPGDGVRLDRVTKDPLPLETSELNAYATLRAAAQGGWHGPVTVTGTLTEHGADRYDLRVRSARGPTPDAA